MPRRRSGKKIDFLHWTYGNKSFANQQAGTAAGSVQTAQHLPETLMRTRGEYIASLDGNEVPGVSANIGLGLILVPEGTGSTVLWSPITDGDAPWYWVDYFSIGYEEPVADVIGSPIISFVRRIVDSKAMRIVKNMEQQLVIENVTVAGALGVNVLFQARFLSGT